MNATVNEPVSVISAYSQEKERFIPYKMRWRLRDYFIKRLAYHHKIREGRTLYHIFHVTDGNLDFKMSFDTETLSWILEEVSDGSAS